MNQSEGIDFHRVSLQDKERITQYQLCNPYQNCDYSFANLYNWGFYYHTQVAYHKGMMLVRFNSPEGNHPAYLMPLSLQTPTPTALLQEVLHDMECHMLRTAQQPLTLMAVTTEGVEQLRLTAPRSLHQLTSRDYSDYIYLRESLATLAGKKLQKRRNHANRFRKEYPLYTCEPITDANVAECLNLETRWYSESDQTTDINEERRMVQTALRECDAIGLHSLAIRANGDIVAFTMGYPLNADTFAVHIEKGDPTIDGAYAIINQEFAQRIPEQYTYINREEDMGVPGLRQAKLALRPVTILDKHTIVIRYDGEEDCL